MVLYWALQFDRSLLVTLALGTKTFIMNPCHFIHVSDVIFCCTCISEFSMFVCHAMSILACPVFMQYRSLLIVQASFHPLDSFACLYRTQLFLMLILFLLFFSQCFLFSICKVRATSHIASDNDTGIRNSNQSIQIPFSCFFIICCLSVDKVLFQSVLFYQPKLPLYQYLSFYHFPFL